MTTRRDGFGRIKRRTGTRDIRRAHLQGAVRMVKEGARPISSFKGRMLSMLNRLF